jgi:two-component system CheB/CheR fusion protein
MGYVSWETALKPRKNASKDYKMADKKANGKNSRANPEKEKELGTDSFPVIGIGASAGGLEALSELFVKMPNDTGAAFVIVQHLAPSKDSAMPELLGRYTKMSIHQVTDNMAISPNTIYLIPPGKNMTIMNGAFQLLDQIEPSRPAYIIRLTSS